MRLIVVFLGCFLFACNQKNSADLVVKNAKIYTADSLFSVKNAMAIKDGKIIATGTTDEILSKFNPAEIIDAKGGFIYPGFIDAHCHFLEYGKGLNECNLVGTESWQQVTDILKTFAAAHPGGWLIGRGWDQNDWPGKSFPRNDELNKLFPGRPVMLSRVDGHAVIVNDYALKLAGISAPFNIAGGEILSFNKKPTGGLIDNATRLIENIIPAPAAADLAAYLKAAEKKCFEVGLTGVQDCGINASDVLLIDSLNKKNELNMRIYAMLSDNPNNYNWAFSHGKINTGKLHVAAFKLYADGALGSRGACLLQPYSDAPGHYGFLLKSISYYDSILSVISSKGWQACTHAIGDSANRAILKLYKTYIQRQADLRWRIEHAQVINEKDFALFGESGIIPSVQPTHATSDMYWAVERLGPDREKGAYAYLRLLKQNGWLPLGTDFPVEDISPFKTFYAAVERKDSHDFPAGGYQANNALSREQALRGMTIWAAKAAFEENEKGTLENGKLADFVILNQDIMTVAAGEILKTKVLATYSGGKKVFPVQ